jgi:hypothetical protein
MNKVCGKRGELLSLWREGIITKEELREQLEKLTTQIIKDASAEVAHPQAGDAKPAEVQIKCNSCKCWRTADEYNKDSVGRMKLACVKCIAKGHRNRVPVVKCPHGTYKNLCLECPGGGTSICPHGGKKHRCVPCGGAGVCHHQRLRYRCKLCKEEARALGLIAAEATAGKDA